MLLTAPFAHGLQTGDASIMVGIITLVCPGDCLKHARTASVENVFELQCSQCQSAWPALQPQGAQAPGRLPEVRLELALKSSAINLLS